MVTKNEKLKTSVSACTFNLRELSVVEFADPETKNRFSIIGYSGDIIPKHWCWGNFAIDLSGLKFAKKKTPVLYRHDRDSRLGFADEQIIDKNVRVTGLFLKNDGAQGIRNDMIEGFPFEASLFVPPSKVEQISEGASAEVNGKTLHGPGAIFREAVVKEVSLLTFGADGKTSAKVFAESDEENIEYETFKLGDNDMDQNENKVPETVEAFKELYPKLFEKAFNLGKAKGQKTERDLFTETVGICGDDSALAVKCFKEGITEPAEIFKMRTAGLEAASQAAAEKTEADKKAAELAASSAEAAGTEFSDTATQHSQNAEQQTGQDDGSPKTEESLTKEFAASKELQNDFESAEEFVACRMAESKGLVSGKGKGLKESA